MFELLGICLLLATLLTFNSLATLATAGLWRLFGNGTRNWSAMARARLIFSLRVVPAAIAILSVLLLVVPSYLAYEPRRGVEDVSLKLAFLAIASAIGIVLAFGRGLAASKVTKRLTEDWIRQSRAISIKGISIPTYQIEHYFPLIAIVGVIRPRLFIARQVLEFLTADEISAALSHENGHLAGRDNLKRGLLRACRDFLLIVPTGRRLDRDWADASEQAADERAAGQGRRVALDLASALVKIARMVPNGARPSMPAGVFLFGDDDGRGLKWRVRHLVNLAAAEVRPDARSQPTMHLIAGLLGLSFVGGFLFLSTSHPILGSIHSLIEYAVAALR